MLDSSRYGLIADDSPVRRFCIAASLRWRKSFSSCSARTRSSIDRIHSVFLVRDRRAASLFATMRFARRGERFSTSSALDRAFGRLLTIPLSCTTSYTPSYSVSFPSLSTQRIATVECAMAEIWRDMLFIRVTASSFCVCTDTVDNYFSPDGLCRRGSIYNSDFAKCQCM